MASFVSVEIEPAPFVFAVNNAVVAVAALRTDGNALALEIEVPIPRAGERSVAQFYDVAVGSRIDGILDELEIGGTVGANRYTLWNCILGLRLGPRDTHKVEIRVSQGAVRMKGRSGPARVTT